jgi:hypothetical protein
MPTIAPAMYEQFARMVVPKHKRLGLLGKEDAEKGLRGSLTA